LNLTDPIVKLAEELGKARSDDQGKSSLGHLGTHLDTYLKQPIPLDRIQTVGKVFDATPFAESGKEIDESVLGGRTISPGDFPIFCTGWLGKHGYGSKHYFAHPEFSWAFLESLYEMGPAFIGLDGAGVRRGDEHEDADHRAEKRGTYIIENIANVDELLTAAGDHDFTVFTGWTGMGGQTGYSCRIVADVTRTG
jgi:kynurenine formamidase